MTLEVRASPKACTPTSTEIFPAFTRPSANSPGRIPQNSSSFALLVLSVSKLNLSTTGIAPCPLCLSKAAQRYVPTSARNLVIWSF